MHRPTACSLAFGLLAIAAPALADDGLTAADVRQVMVAHGDEVRACYLRHGMPQRAATGKVTVSVVVQKSGETREVTVDAPGVKGQKMTRCVASSAKAWRFPETSSVTEVQLPFLFQHTNARGAGPSRTRRSSL